MVQARYRHASCAIGSKVYVFCGMDVNAKKVHTIEVLDTNMLERGWRGINGQILGERIFPGV